MATRRTRLTVLEIFVVTVLLAAVAAVGVWWHARERSFQYLEVVKGDLRNLAAAQDAYSADNGSFMPQNSRVTTRQPYNGYAPSSDVVVSIAEPTASGWSATAVHQLVIGAVCGIYAGPAPSSPNPATEPGEPRCQ